MQQSISTDSTPFFYLHVTDFIFKTLIRIDFPVPVAINSESDEIDEEAATEERTNKLDRGGLWHINDVYNLFVAIEFEAKRLLLLIKKDESSLNLKKNYTMHSIVVKTSNLNGGFFLQK